MKISIVTLFPEVFDPILNSSILKRAQQKGLVIFELIDLRQFGQGAHKIVDDSPYGGGAGMVLKAEVLAAAISAQKLKKDKDLVKVILTTASGQSFTQPLARKLSKLEEIILVCGHYEGVDQRFIDHYVDLELSIGDYVLTGGELPAMIIADSVTRLIPGVLEKEGATENESYEKNTLEHPHYTRPEVFEELRVPEVLLSGNHAKIQEWRENESLKRTEAIRPDLLKKN